jgi:hypothetical protein
MDPHPTHRRGRREPARQPALAGAAATGARILIGIVLILFLLVVLGLFAVT